MTESAAAPHLPEFGIFLVAHTNVGKTTLIRTLLGKDVGEIEDAPDVTKAVTSYDLVVDRTAGALRLWDTPGFGDSFRLARRFRQRHRWVAWAIRECWDRAFNQKLWRGQRLVLDLRTRASVILYPVSLLERPVDAVYVAPELEIMAWVGKPVLAIFNQGVGLQSQASEVERVNEWQRHLSGFPAVRSVLRLDAYTRCWLQELALYRELEAGWLEGIKDVWTSLRKSIPWGKSKDMTPFEVAMQGLAQRYAEGTKAVTDKLIAINRLDGVSASEIVETADAKLVTDKPVDGGSSALVGGVISGILTGLGADLLTGGLTLGSGALVGGVLGAMGAAALAKGYNVYTHKNMKMVGWSGESLTEAFGKSVMLYISIAHFGRGQGQWRRKEDPTNWTIAANEVLQRDGERLKRLWAKVGAPASSQREEGECETEVRHFLREVLRHLYPESRTVLPEERFGAGKSAAQLNLPIKEKSSS